MPRRPRPRSGDRRPRHPTRDGRAPARRLKLERLDQLQQVPHQLVIVGPAQLPHREPADFRLLAERVVRP